MVCFCFFGGGELLLLMGFGSTCNHLLLVDYSSGNNRKLTEEPRQVFPVFPTVCTL